MSNRERVSTTMIPAVLGLIAIVLTIACAGPESAVYAERGQPQAEAGVLAVAGGVEITETEVAELLAAQLRKIEMERYELLKQGTDQLVAERLLELEAKQRDMTLDELISQEVEAKVDEPTEAEIDAFYEERKARIRQPKEEVAGQIRDFLLGQRLEAVQGELIEGLKKKHGYQLLLAPIRVTVAADGFPAKGPADAPVTIVEFSDFECPYCARVNPALDDVVEKYGDDVRLVFRQFPLMNIHPNAQKAAEASLCANEQGKFWEMHDAMFKEQRSLGVEQLKEKAARLDLDASAFNECLDSSRFAEAVMADLRAGTELGVSGTPAFFINGRFMSGAQPFDALAAIVEEELELRKRES